MYLKVVATAKKIQGCVSSFLTALPMRPGERTWVPVPCCCWQNSSLPALCQESLFTLRLLWPRWTLQVSAWCSGAPFLLCSRLLSCLTVLGHFSGQWCSYTSVNMDRAEDNLRAFRGSALYFLGMFFTHDLSSVESPLRPNILDQGQKNYINVLIFQFIVMC